eukprot:s419_g32.t1
MASFAEIIEASKRTVELPGYRDPVQLRSEAWWAEALSSTDGYEHLAIVKDPEYPLKDDRLVIEAQNILRPETDALAAEGTGSDVGMKDDFFASKVIILQGVFGTIPSAAQSFTTMYLQYMGVSNAMCGLILALRTVGEGLGNALGGYLGDIAHMRRPTDGRTHRRSLINDEQT